MNIKDLKRKKTYVVEKEELGSEGEVLRRSFPWKFWKCLRREKKIIGLVGYNLLTQWKVTIRDESEIREMTSEDIQHFGQHKLLDFAFEPRRLKLKNYGKNSEPIPQAEKNK